MVYRYGVGGQQYVISKEQYFTLRNTPREQREQKLREWGIIPAAPSVPAREDVIAQQQLAEAEAEKQRKLEWIKQQEQKGAILSPTLKEKIAQAESPKARIIAGEETTVSPGVAHKLGLITKAEYEKEKNTSAFYVVRRQKERNILEPSQRIIGQPEESFPRLLTQSIMESGHKTTEFVSPTMTKQELLQKKVYAKAPLWMKYASEFTRQSSPIVAATSLIAPSRFVTPGERAAAGLGLGLAATLPFAPALISAPILIGAGGYTVATQYPAARKGDISAQVSTVLGGASVLTGSLMLADKIISSMKRPEVSVEKFVTGEVGGKEETYAKGVVVKKGLVSKETTEFQTLMESEKTERPSILSKAYTLFKKKGVSQTEAETIPGIANRGEGWMIEKEAPGISTTFSQGKFMQPSGKVSELPTSKAWSKLLSQTPTGETYAHVGMTEEAKPSFFYGLTRLFKSSPKVEPTVTAPSTPPPMKPFTMITESPTLTAHVQTAISGLPSSSMKAPLPFYSVLQKIEKETAQKVIQNTGAYFSRVGTPQPKYVLESRVIQKQRGLTREEQEAEMMKVIGIGVTGTKLREKERSKVGMGVGIISAPIQQQIQKQQKALETALRYNVATQQRTRVTGIGKVGKVYPGRVPGRVIRPEFELENQMFGKRKFRPGFYRYFERNWPVATTPEEISMAFGFGKKKKKR